MGVMVDNTLLVYILSERTETSETVEVETVQGEGDDVTVRTFEVDDSEPLDVWGLIFSRVFGELGITLSDPGDFDMLDLSKEPGGGIPDAFLITINCEFTED